MISIISSSGLGISSFFSIYLLRKPSLQNRLLAFLLLALSLRITKSIFYATVDLPLFIRNLGLAANLAVGPLLFLYTKALSGHKELHKAHYLHFVPTLLYVGACTLLPNGGESLYWKLSYPLILTQSFLYVFLSMGVLIRERPALKKHKFNWLTGLLVCLTLMWTVYTLNFLKIIPIYALGPITFSILMFCLLAVAIENKEAFFSRPVPQYKGAQVTQDQAKMHLGRLKELMEAEGMYKNPELTVSDVSAALGTSTRNVSLILNKYGETNFSSFINQYRIEEAKRLLKARRQEKILAIAYDAGFKNLATFNQVFKAYTGQTPSAYKKNA